jgi:hypothetical protein
MLDNFKSTCSQKPTTRPYPSQLNTINNHQNYFCIIHFNIILPLMPRSSVWSLHFRLSNQNFLCSSSGRVWLFKKYRAFNRRGDLITPQCTPNIPPWLLCYFPVAEWVMHTCKHTSSLGIVSDVPSAVIRINSPVFLWGAAGSVHFCWNKFHYWTSCVYCRNLRKEKSYRKCIRKFHRKYPTSPVSTKSCVCKLVKKWQAT